MKFSRKNSGYLPVRTVSCPDDFEGEVDLSELYIPDRILGVYNEDGRKIRMEGNIMKDTFRSNETHVYFVE